MQDEVAWIDGLAVVRSRTTLGRPEHRPQRAANNKSTVTADRCPPEVPCPELALETRPWEDPTMARLDNQKAFQAAAEEDGIRL